MVRNKRELIMAANQWVGTAKRDIAQHAAEFMRRTGVTIEQLANILDINSEMARGMLDGTADIPMSVFAKMLIASDHVIVITPVSDMPQSIFDGRANTRQDNPNRPNCHPARDARGRFTSKRSVMPFGFPMPNPSGMIPTPEEFFNGFNTSDDFGMENDDSIPMENNDSIPMENEEQHDAPKGDEFDALVDALRQNPTIANLFKRIFQEQ